MFLFGVVNASPDSLNADSIVHDEETARHRVSQLLADGCDGIDLGGQGSTELASEVSWQQEWSRVREVLSAVSDFEVPISIDSWHSEVVQLALESGASVINASDGMQNPAMWEVAAQFQAPIVLPFMMGPTPRNLRRVLGDPIQSMLEFFERRLAVAEANGLREQCMLDPGTGFAHGGWSWQERYEYQKHVYKNLDSLRVFDLPLYVPLPWKDTAQHDELLQIALAQSPEFGRVHYPTKVRALEAQLRRRRHLP